MKRFIKKLIEEQIPLKEYYADLSLKCLSVF